MSLSAVFRSGALLLLIGGNGPKHAVVRAFLSPSSSSATVTGTGIGPEARATMVPPAALFDGSSCIGGASSFPRSASAFAVGRRDVSTTAMTASSSTDAAAVAVTTAEVNDKPTGKIPVVILGGFLGAGKTTALRGLLENTDGIRVGTIVNDVASVNIDAKLISNPMNNAARNGSSGTVELQNGCACCSLSDELLTSVSDLMEGRDLDAIVVELSGVADPAAVRQNWAQAVNAKHPATQTAELGRVVTVVDSHTFGTDWMTWDTAGKRDWAEEGANCAASSQIPELLAEQVEAADVIILNKIDLSEGEQLDTARVVAQSLNEKAEVIETKFGEMTPEKIIGDIAAEASKKEEEEEDDGHSHSHEHSSHDDGACSEPNCADSSDSHSHEHTASEEASCSDPDCGDASHDHSQSSSEGACSDPDCSDASHDHSHSSEEACADPGCTDTSHSHSHDHRAAATTTDSLGISNFVYKSSRPFDPRKLQTLLMSWPIPVLEELNLVELSKELKKEDGEGGGSEDKCPFVGVLRSKGYAWVAPSTMSGPYNDLDRHDTVLYWSHAGKHFGLKEAGSWWASMGKDAMKEMFEGKLEEYDRIISEDFVSGEWGDRRQELVFIGAQLNEDGIREALDSCLCTDEQIGEYKQAILDAISEYYAQ